MRGAFLVGFLLFAPTAHALDVPRLAGRVVDLGGVLDDATEAALTARLAAHEDSTSNQIVVLTIPSLDGEVLEAYATRVFRVWGLGQADRDNGVLLLVAVADRELRIEVGYGLEGALTDATAGSIIRNEIVPRFRDGDFDGGVLAGVDAILRAVDGEYEAAADGGAESVSIAFVFGFMILVGGVLPMLRAGDAGTAGDAKAAAIGMLTGTVLGFLTWRLTGWWLAAILVPVAFAFLLIGLNRWLEAHPTWGPRRRHIRKKHQAFARARRRGASTVVVDGRSYTVPTASSSSGGGFSGGGGSSGGGGASGGW